MVRWLGSCILLVLLVSGGFASEWAQWRGPMGDGTLPGANLPERWPSQGLKRIWRQPIGGGYAGIAVAGGRVYTMDLARPTDEDVKTGADGRERVLCFDADDGRLLWSHTYPVKYGDLGGYANGPRAMPVVKDGKVYVLGAVGHAHCLDAASGKAAWSRDLVAECAARIPTWGFAAVPVVDGDRVILHVGAEPGGCVLALDKSTGKELWRSLADPAGYCTPVFIDAPGGRQLIVWSPENVHGIDARNGKPLWSIPYKVTYGVSIATPIFREGILFVSGYWEGAKAVVLGPRPTDARLAWEDKRELKGLMAQPLHRQGFTYLLDHHYGLTCFELKTGEKRWDDAHRLTPRGRNPHASIVWLGDTDRILALNARGELILARLTPDGYQEQSRTQLLDGEVWSHPAFTRDRIYARSDGADGWRGSGPHEIVCVSLTQANE